MLSTYHWQILPNGMKLATASIPTSECATLAFYIPVGSRHESNEFAGLAHFMEHMAFKGTTKRTAQQLSRDLESSGAQANACTTEDCTIYDARGDAASLPLIAEILSDMIWHSIIPEKEIELERDVIHEEITMYEESPSDHIGDLISQALWAPHPLGHSITGTHKSLDHINRRHLIDFFQQHYFRKDLIITAAGPFTSDEFAEIMIPHIPKNIVESDQLVESFVATNQPSTVTQERETEQLQLAIAYHTAGRGDTSRHALKLLSLILGESASSRLFQNLREEKGLCYHISSDVSLFHDTGAFEITTGLDPENREEAIEAIEDELRKISSVGPTEDELNRAKKIAITSHKLALESTGSHMTWAGESLFYDGEIISPIESRAKLEPVTCAEIRDLAAKIFIPENRSCAEIRPPN
jgi:predicted Zn-dependent peptidase